MSVKAKKHLGQHFLTDKNICRKIADAVSEKQTNILEIGPGMGALTEFLLEKQNVQVSVVEIDSESVAYLQTHYGEALKDRIFEVDFLKADLQSFMGSEAFSLVGNFPYNISSQILFKALEYRNQIPEIVGMFQKEVAERVAEQPGSKTYGILSVLLQTFYEVNYLFTVHESVFNPPPKVKSGVISLHRNTRIQLPCDEKLYFQVVKTAFNQRRKTLRNSLKVYLDRVDTSVPIFQKRPEQLGVEEFIELTKLIDKQRTSF